MPPATQLSTLSDQTSYPVSELDVLAQRFIDDQIALGKVVGFDADQIFEANSDFDELGFINHPFGINPRPAIWFQLAISAFVEDVVGPKKDEKIPAGQGAPMGKTTDDAFITTVVDFESVDYPNFTQPSYPSFAIRESSLDHQERRELIERLRGLYQRWEFSKLYYASLKKVNPFNNLLDQICVILARLDSNALPDARIFPDHQPQLETFSADDLMFIDEPDNEFYPQNTWHGWTRDQNGEVLEPLYVAHGDAQTFNGQGVRYLRSHNTFDPMWGRTGFVPGNNAVFVDSFLDSDS